MSSNSKYIGLREAHGHSNEYVMGTVVEGGLEKDRVAHAGLGNSRFWPNTSIFHQEQQKIKPHQETKLSFKFRLSKTTTFFFFASSSELKSNSQRCSKGCRLRHHLQGAGTAHTYD